MDEVKLEETLLSQYVNAAQEGRDESMNSPAQQNILLRTPLSQESEENVVTHKISSKNEVKSEFPQVGRNDLCPCGSGKKYKQCHGKNA